MKNEFTWAKTLLCAYRYLERLAGSIDKILMKKALSSAHMNSLNMNALTSEVVTKSMLELMERKVTMINLKVLIEDCLSSMKTESAAILIDKFVSGMKLKELSEKHQSSTRNMFRKVENALSSFENQLSLRGYDEAKLARLTQNEEWIKSAFNRFACHEENVVFSKISLARAVS